MEAFDLHNKEFEELVGKGKKSDGTLIRYQRTKRKVEAYLLKKIKRKDVTLTDIQFEMAPSFYHYLIILIKTTKLQRVKLIICLKGSVGSSYIQGVKYTTEVWLLLHLYIVSGIRKTSCYIC